MRRQTQFGVRWLVALLTAWLTLTPCAAQNQEKDAKSPNDAGKPSDSEEPVYEMGKDITPPRLIYQVTPAYDTGSKGFRVAGKVLIRLVVTSHGLPKDPAVVQGLDEEIDASAVTAVKQWRFDPAKREGKTVAVRVVVSINFHPM